MNRTDQHDNVNEHLSSAVVFRPAKIVNRNRFGQQKGKTQTKNEFY